MRTLICLMFAALSFGSTPAAAGVEGEPTTQADEIDPTVASAAILVSLKALRALESEVRSDPSVLGANQSQLLDLQITNLIATQGRLLTNAALQ